MADTVDRIGVDGGAGVLDTIDDPVAEDKVIIIGSLDGEVGTFVVAGLAMDLVGSSLRVDGHVAVLGSDGEGVDEVGHYIIIISVDGSDDIGIGGTGEVARPAGEAVVARGGRGDGDAGFCIVGALSVGSFDGDGAAIGGFNRGVDGVRLMLEAGLEGAVLEDLRDDVVKVGADACATLIPTEEVPVGGGRSGEGEAGVTRNRGGASHGAHDFATLRRYGGSRHGVGVVVGDEVGLVGAVAAAVGQAEAVDSLGGDHGAVERPVDKGSRRVGHGSRQDDAVALSDIKGRRTRGTRGMVGDGSRTIGRIVRGDSKDTRLGNIVKMGNKVHIPGDITDMICTCRPYIYT